MTVVITLMERLQVIIKQDNLEYSFFNKNHFQILLSNHSFISVYESGFIGCFTQMLSCSVIMDSVWLTIAH